MTTPEARHAQDFCELATQYYVAARIAARGALMPVYGNLFHHAVELYLKASLVATISLKKLKRPPFGHDLTVLWARFKQVAVDPALDRYDFAIRTLDKFERIRYPDLGAQRLFLVWRSEGVGSGLIEWAKVNCAGFPGGSRP
jgi:HEPN domain-containing protein